MPIEKSSSPLVSKVSSQYSKITNSDDDKSKMLCEQSLVSPAEKQPIQFQTSFVSTKLLPLELTTLLEEIRNTKATIVNEKLQSPDVTKDPIKVQNVANYLLNSLENPLLSLSSEERLVLQRTVDIARSTLNNANANLADKSCSSTATYIVPIIQIEQKRVISIKSSNEITLEATRHFDQLNKETVSNKTDQELSSKTKLKTKLNTFQATKAPEGEQSPKNYDKRITYDENATTTNEQSSNPTHFDGGTPGDPNKRNDTQTSENQRSKRPDDSRRSNEPSLSDEEFDESLEKRMLRTGIFIICVSHLMSIIIAVVVFFLVYISDMTYKINLLIRVLLAIGIVIKGLHMTLLFVGAYREDPVALHCGTMLGWLVFITQEVIGVMGFTFFVRIIHLTLNFLLTLYFACLIITESFSFCRNAVIITAYRELLLSRPLDGNVLLLALCCSSCNVAEYVQARRRHPT